MSRTLLILALALVGCGSNDPELVTLHPDAAPIAPFVECTVEIRAAPPASANHQTPCTPTNYQLPTAGGDHYSVWADFGAYAQPVPWGFLVHSMEHGAVVLSYRCEGADCAPIEAAFDALRSRQPADALCVREDVPNRLIVAPEPSLEWPIALSAWGHTYRATCIDPASLADFVDAHYAGGPEDLCVPGRRAEGDEWCPGS